MRPSKEDIPTKEEGAVKGRTVDPYKSDLSANRCDLQIVRLNTKQNNVLTSHEVCGVQHPIVRHCERCYRKK